MTEANEKVIKIDELKDEINELKREIAEKTTAVAQTTAINYGKMKEALDEKTDEILSKVKPYVEQGKQKTMEAAEQLEDTVKEHPIKSVAIAFVAGLLLSKLFDRR